MLLGLGINDEDKERLDKLIKVCKLKNYAEVLTVGVILISWAVEERKRGATIGSFYQVLNEFKVFKHEALDNIPPFSP